MGLGDLIYELKRFGAKMLGKTTSWGIVTGVAAAFGGSANSAGHLFASYLGVGLGVGVSAGLTHMDHQRNEWNLLNFYRAEIGAKLRKDPRTLTLDDLHLAAKGDAKQGIIGNPTLQEEIKRNDQWRWRNVAFSTLAAVTTFGVMSATGLLGAALIAKLLIGPAIFFTAKHSFEWLHEHAVSPLIAKVTGKPQQIVRPTLHGAVVGMQQAIAKKKQVTHDMVMNAFALGNPAIGDQIKARFGQAYRDLPLEDRMRVLPQFADSLNLRALTDDINQGHIRAHELAFIVHGQKSGVRRVEEIPQGLTERAREVVGKALQAGKETLGNAGEAVKEKACAAWDVACQKAQAAKEAAQQKLAMLRTNTSGVALPAERSEAMLENGALDRPAEAKEAPAAATGGEPQTAPKSLMDRVAAPTASKAAAIEAASALKPVTATR